MFKKLGMMATERVWYGTGVIPSLARTILFPFELLYKAIITTRNNLYDRRVMGGEQPALPCVSIGNLTVGGSGKTPVAAWFVTQLAERGAHPAVVMRGYGGADESDELLVHERLNPKAPVIAEPERAKGVREAVAQGADLVVLDDAFQHRAVSCLENIVLLNADRWTQASKKQRLLPAGPWRENLSALRRASLAIITTKAADPAQISSLETAISNVAPNLKVAVAYLLPDTLALATGAESPELLDLKSLEESRVFAVTSIADPLAFQTQLADVAEEVIGWAFPDHYAFNRKEVEAIAAEARKYDIAVCTLKDAVKLGPLWPALAPKLWYVQQRVEIESGKEHVDEILNRLTDRTLKLV